MQLVDERAHDAETESARRAGSGLHCLAAKTATVVFNFCDYGATTHPATQLE